MDYVVLCLEMALEDFVTLYSLAQRRGKDVKTYIRDLIREDALKMTQEARKEG